eukprot:TRINITY_DN4382_c0_g1_i2.p1 TRINITY_DN4382_c0_g1~~TRINITY_DN4382_c0_g1_i2.p1  ORF type:complete len:374 (+),score=95.64 TRINITY_DN4382_c0_g1_i2:46-1167(+)
MLELLCAASAFAAEAQCPVTGTEQCIMRVDPYFGSTYIMHTVYGHPYFAQPFLPHEARAICRKDKMDQLNHCAVNADFRFVVTSPAEWAGEKFAVNHQRYQPWFDTQNLDQNHEKMGKEYEVVVPGFGSPLGCDPAEWAGRGAQDQIAMTHLFGCWSFRKIHAVQASGQEPAIYMMSGYDSGEELAPFEGSSVGIEHIPSVMGAGALWFMAQELEMKGGERLRGKFELHCPAEAEAFPEREFSDGCPDDRLVGVCNDMPNPEDRLCSKCPLQLKFEGEKVCLYSNRLIPSRKRNFLQATHKPGDNIEVIMIDPNPWEGCSPTDYQHAAVAGKIVAFQFQGCMVSNPGTLAGSRPPAPPRRRYRGNRRRTWCSR